MLVRIVGLLSLLILVPACNRTESQSGAMAEGAHANAAQSNQPGPIMQSEVHTLASRGRDSRADEPQAALVKVELVNHAQLMQRTQQYRGKVVVVDVWSTSCVPCMREFPHLVELARKWPEDVVCISMNVDFIGLPDKPAETVVGKVVEFLTSQQADPTNLVNLVANEPDTDVLAKLDVESMPAILVMDRSGQSAAKLTINNAGADGLTYTEDVFPLVEKLVRGATLESNSGK